MANEAAMSGLPTTPVREEVRSSHSGLESDEVVLRGNAGELKVHRHGLSANKRLERDPGEASDMSLDCVRRSDEKEQAESVFRSEQKNALDQIDINRMFSTSPEADGGAESSTIYVKHSPMKLDMSSPLKQNVGADGEGPQPKKLKLELECVPDLGQPGALNGGDGMESPVGSPEAIEMIEAKSSPMKEFSQVVYEPEEKERDEPRSEKALTAAETTPGHHGSGLHTLSPVHQSGDAVSDMSLFQLEQHDDDGETFSLLTSRNEELVEQVHKLNQKLNRMMSTCDVTSYRYKKQKADFEILTRDCDTKLRESHRELQLAIQERDRLKERTVMLKKRIDENRDEVEMLNQNQSVLQRKYTVLLNEAEDARNKYEDLDAKHRNLKEQCSEDERRKQILQNQIDAISSQISHISEENASLKKLNEDLSKEVDTTAQELNVRTSEVQKLQDQLREAIEAKQGASDQVLEQVNALIAQKAELESQFEDYKFRSEAENEKLILRAKEADDRLNDRVGELRDLQDKLDQSLENAAAKETLIQKLKADLEEANDKTEIAEAQTKELQEEKAELGRVRGYMESSIAELEESLREWQAKYEEQAEKQKTSIELETLQLKNGNIEAEHLAELEQLHSNLSALQEDLKQNSEKLNKLRSENDSLRQTKESLEAKLEEALQKVAANDDHDLVKSLQKELELWKDKFQLKEQELNRSLKLLAEDLYIQYSSKHEQKVKLLKKGYETKFQGKLDKLTLQNEGLTQEVEQVKAQLASERKEKQKLIDLLESRKSQE